MPTQFSSTHGTCMLYVEDVIVPAQNIIGQEHMGLMALFYNFNKERWVIAAAACRQARVAYAEALRWAKHREVWGERLIDNAVVRSKLAGMASAIQSTWNSLEKVTQMFNSGLPDSKLGVECGLLKVQASDCLELCAREASLLFGGSAIVQEGQGKVVERIYRTVLATVIPGGSRDVMLDWSGKEIAKKVRKSNL